MPISSTILAAVVVAASALTPAVAGASSALTSSSESQSVTAAASITSVDWFQLHDKVVTGVATPGTESVRISGLNLRPGAYREGAVSPDGTFTVDLAPFASRVTPFATLTATAVAADGSIGGTKTFIVELDPAPTASGSSSPSALNISTASVTSKHIATTLEVDTISAGADTITGIAPVGTEQIAVDVFGSTIFGDVTADGAFSIDLGSYAAYTIPGVDFEVWGAATDGSILPSVFVTVN